MDEFNSKRIEYIKTKLDTIIRNASEVRQSTIAPLRKDVNIALNVVKQFIIEKGKIIYGGMSQNEFIKLKNKKDAIYSEDSLDIPDFDIYSSTPIVDIVTVCNKLYNMGYKDVYAGEAAHEGTYSIFLDRITGNILDVHYMWSNHYKIIPYKKIGDFNFVEPEFMFIDLYKIYTDPMLSYELRLEKVFNRTSLLEKYYPIKHDDKYFNVYQYKEIKSEYRKIINTIIKTYISKNSNIILCGLFAYNFYVNKVDKSKMLNINYLTLLTDDIYKVQDEIIQEMVKMKLDKNSITIDKYHPFYEVFDNILKIKYKNVVLFEIMGNLNRCVPYISVRNKKDIQLQFISYHGLLLHLYSNMFLSKFKKKYKTIQFFKCIIYYLQQARLQYLKKNNLTGIEVGIFAELGVKCKFDTIADRILQDHKIKANMKKGKAYTWTYRPTKKFMQPNSISPFIYPNTSGNLMNKN